MDVTFSPRKCSALGLAPPLSPTAPPPEKPCRMESRHSRKTAENAGQSAMPLRSNGVAGTDHFPRYLEGLRIRSSRSISCSFRIICWRRRCAARASVRGRNQACLMGSLKARQKFLIGFIRLRCRPGQRPGSLGAGGTGRAAVLPAVDRFYERVSPEPVRSLPRFKLELRIQHQVTGADQFVEPQAAQAGRFIRWHRGLWWFAGLTIQVGSRAGSRAGGGV